MASEEQASSEAMRARVEEDMEAVCAVCMSGEVGPARQIVFCEHCNVAVHQHVMRAIQSPKVVLRVFFSNRDFQ